MIRKTCICVTAALFCGLSTVGEIQAVELIDAHTIITTAQKADVQQKVVTGKPGLATVNAATQALAAYKKLVEVEVIDDPAHPIDPARRAAAWALALTEYYKTLNETSRWNDSSDDADKNDYSYLFTTMPDPQAWPFLKESFAQLATQVDAHPAPPKTSGGLLSRIFGGGTTHTTQQKQSMEFMLPLIASVLMDDWVAIRAFLTSMPSVKNNYSVKELQHAVIEILLQQERDPQAIYDLMKVYIQTFANQEHGNGYHFLKIPDLTQRLSQEQQLEIAQKLLHLKARDLDFDDLENNAFVAVCLQVLSDQRAQISMPHWKLLANPGTEALFAATREKIEKNMSAKDDEGNGYNDYAFSQAFTYYIVNLIVADKTEEAKKQLRQYLTEVNKKDSSNRRSYYFHGIAHKLTEKGLLKPAFEIIDTLIAEGYENESLWSAYVSIAVQLERVSEIKERLESLIEQKGKALSTLHVHYAKILFGEDELERGYAVIAQLMAVQDLDDETKESLNAFLIQLSWIYPEKEYLDYVFKHTQLPESYSDIDDLVAVAIEHKRLSELQDLASRWLSDLIKDKPDDDNQHWGNDAQDGSPALALLCRIYLESGQVDQAVALVKRAPWWNSKDVLSLAITNGYMSDDAMRTEDWYAVLKAAGRVDEAQQLIRYALYKDNNNDAYYRAYLDAEPDAATAMSEFRILEKRDPFQERPIIWQAHVLIQQQQFQKALTYCQRAVEIDPSDGEQGRGSRMRVYALMAEAYAGLGNTDKKVFFEKVVASIRLSENADLYVKAGHYQRAIVMYREGLALFGDAYCIQTRLARRLYEIGQWEEASKHYRRAFELMPDSFGRMESHCFGCEGAFRGARIQSIAEEIFAKRIAQSPNNPRVHYLLGYLRTEQGRYKQAAASFKKACALDPLYINAWKKLLELRTKADLSPEEIMKARLALLKMDPRGVHSSGVKFNDHLAELWSAAETLAQEPRAQPPEKPTQLMSFAAYEEPKDNNSWISHSSYGENDYEMPSPSTLVFRHKILQAIQSVSE